MLSQKALRVSKAVQATPFVDRLLIKQTFANSLVNKIV